jgi:hypothetical protein
MEKRMNGKENEWKRESMEKIINGKENEWKRE